MSKFNKLYSQKQAMLMPRIEMERELHLMGLEQARVNLERRIEEAEIWESLYQNEQMLKTSLTNQFTWADILEGMVDVLPPRDTETRPVYPLAELNRRFITFKTKKMKELFGTRAQRRPNYRDLYNKQMRPKERNDSNFNELMERYQRDREDLFRKQSLFTPALPKIIEEKSGKNKTETRQINSGTSVSGHSRHSTETNKETIGETKDRDSRKKVNSSQRERKLSSVQTGKGTLTLAKSTIVVDGLQDQLKVAKKRKQSTRKMSTENFPSYPKLPAISNSEESTSL